MRIQANSAADTVDITDLKDGEVGIASSSVAQCGAFGQPVPLWFHPLHHLEKHLRQAEGAATTATRVCDRYQFANSRHGRLPTTTC